jgi:hypothetical protein
LNIIGKTKTKTQKEEEEEKKRRMVVFKPHPGVWDGRGVV